eukprot:6850860-Prymnesium_polylepis.1
MWPSRVVEALCLEADPERVALFPDGVWMDHEFPLRAGHDGVLWSRDRGYELDEFDGMDDDLLEELGGDPAAARAEKARLRLLQHSVEHGWSLRGR